MRIRATVKIEYEVNEGDYAFVTKGDRDEQILDFEHTLLCNKAHGLRGFSPFIADKTEIFDISLVEVL